MSPGEIDRLVSEYRGRGLLLDSNLVVLLVVGAVSPECVARHRRTSAYTSDDFEILQRFCGFFARLVTLPNVLTEASDLLYDGREQALLRALCIESWDETTVVSREAAATREYEYLGLADAAILSSTTASFLVLTDDNRLAAAIMNKQGPVIHFDWLRVIAAR